MLEYIECHQSRKQYIKIKRRREYVLKASEIIQHEGMEACTIRRMSQEMDCSSTAMYRHFNNLDELHFYALLGHLNTYVRNLILRSPQWTSDWEVHLGIWEINADLAFRKPKAFELIFCKNIKPNLGLALKEYYEMFPESTVHIPPNLSPILETSGFYERDYKILEKIVNDGGLTEEMARKINRIECTLFLGYFNYVCSAQPPMSDLPAIVSEYTSEIREIISMYTGTSLCASDN